MSSCLRLDDVLCGCCLATPHLPTSHDQRGTLQHSIQGRAVQLWHDTRSVPRRNPLGGIRADDGTFGPDRSLDNVASTGDRSGDSRGLYLEELSMVCVDEGISVQHNNAARHQSKSMSTDGIECGGGQRVYQRRLPESLPDSVSRDSSVWAHGRGL